jgi:hypothetical protein
MNGRTIRVGDRVTAISLYNGQPMNTGAVVSIRKAGADGTIVQLDTPPSSDYPHHFTHRASLTVKVPR